MNIDIQKAKHVFATLQEEKRAQQDRLKLAAQAIQHLDQTIVQRTHSSLQSERVLKGQIGTVTLRPMCGERHNIIDDGISSR